MTRFTEFDKQLKARGLTYDTGDEVFRDGKRILKWQELLRILPEMTLDELASYQDDGHDKLRAKRRKARR